MHIWSGVADPKFKLDVSAWALCKANLKQELMGRHCRKCKLRAVPVRRKGHRVKERGRGESRDAQLCWPRLSHTVQTDAAGHLAAAFAQHVGLLQKTCKDKLRLKVVHGREKSSSFPLVQIHLYIISLGPWVATEKTPETKPAVWQFTQVSQ